VTITVEDRKKVGRKGGSEIARKRRNGELVGRDEVEQQHGREGGVRGNNSGRKEERKKGRKEERKKGRKEERKKGRKEERKKGRVEELTRPRTTSFFSILSEMYIIMSK
jgi:hypothetical protein